jgi:predicted transcriptional regulator
VKHQVEHKDKHQVELTETQTAILKLLKGKSLTRKEIFTSIDLNGDSRAFKRHVQPLLAAGFIERTVPDKPNSRLQKYRLSEAGVKTL